MWTCRKCGRIFEKQKQMHSCRKIPLEQHFWNKDKSKELFDVLVKRIEREMGQVKIISLPCCVHLFGKYDFLAALPKNDNLEIRFALDRVLDSSRLSQSVPLSAKTYKNCIDINNVEEIDQELLSWIDEAYHLKDE